MYFSSGYFSRSYFTRAYFGPTVVTPTPPAPSLPVGGGPWRPETRWPHAPTVPMDLFLRGSSGVGIGARGVASLTAAAAATSPRLGLRGQVSLSAQGAARFQIRRVEGASVLRVVGAERLEMRAHGVGALYLPGATTVTVQSASGRARTVYARRWLIDEEDELFELDL